MLLSILTPTFNRASTYLIPMVESVFLADMSPSSVELLLVDDHSSDNTSEVVRQLQQKYPFIRYFQTPGHAGPAVARNIALRAAQGEFIADIDDDDIVPFFALRERIRLLEESGKAWLHGSAFQIDEQGMLLYKDNLICKKIAGRSQNFLAFYEGKHFAYSGAKVYRRDALEKVGGWDESHAFIAEDFELWLKLCHLVGEPAQTELPLIFYRKKQESLGINAVHSGEMKKSVQSIREKYAQEYVWHKNQVR